VALNSLETLKKYTDTNDSQYLSAAIINAETLRSNAIRIDSLLYFPFYFPFRLFKSDMYRFYPPWTSGLSQGLMLSAYSRLYYFTKNKDYLCVADSIFATFSDFRTKFSPVFISRNDNINHGPLYYWVDIYPHARRTYVLNGSMIGSLGMYDYWWVTKSALAKTLLSRELTTIKANLPKYRFPSSFMFYDLAYRHTNDFYHKWVLLALKQFYMISGDQFFKEWYDILFGDYHTALHYREHQ